VVGLSFFSERVFFSEPGFWLLFCSVSCESCCCCCEKEGDVVSSQ
jgi:hypothetical protein